MNTSELSQQQKMKRLQFNKLASQEIQIINGFGNSEDPINQLRSKTFVSKDAGK